MAYLRIGAVGVLAFNVLYVVHRILQAMGSGSSDAATVIAYEIAHRGRLLISEIAVCMALLAFLAFVATLIPVVWWAGQEALAVAIGLSGAIFVALGFVSSAAETALVWVAATHDPTAVNVLDQLQGRIPIIWSGTTCSCTRRGSATRSHRRPRAPARSRPTSLASRASSRQAERGPESPWR